MAATLSLEWKPTLNFNATCQWAVPAKDLLEVDGEKFVHIMQGGVCFGFPRLIHQYAKDEGHDLGDKAKWSLTSSNGYQELRKLRNDAQSRALVAHLPEWQRATAKASTTKKRRSKEQGQDAAVNAPGALVVSVPGVGGKSPRDVRMVRPVSQYEELKVELEPDGLLHMMEFIVSHGFAANSRKRDRNPEMPKGIRRRKMS